VPPTEAGHGGRAVRVHMAHGEMVMLGAYTTFVVQQAVGPAFTGISLFIAVPAAFIVAGRQGL
jgi:urea transport system permease protein